jgi:hypothetical protein
MRSYPEIPISYSTHAHEASAIEWLGAESFVAGFAWPLPALPTQLTSARSPAREEAAVDWQVL